jgi:hypothetical protein
MPILHPRHSTVACLAFAVLMLVATEHAARAADGKPTVIRSAGNGPWSASTTWEGGKVPAELARVLIRQGHRVVYDVKSSLTIRAINVAGTLTFDPDRDTQLVVGLIVIQPGETYCESGFDCEAHVSKPDPAVEKPALEVGTPNRPIGAKHTAVIRLHYIYGMDRESCPGIVCCGGRMDIHGTPMPRTWVRLGATAKEGDREVRLSEEVPGWRVGDQVFLTSTQFRGPRSEPTEERTIKALDGTTLRLDEPLEHPHLGHGDYHAEVANLSRNVVVESANPESERGHVMYHRHSAGAISYAEFRHLGKKDVLGRYSLHYHLCGDTMRGSYVLGASIHDSQNRFLTIHGTNYLVVRDCVGYKSIGHGFFMEDATEVYNVLDRNLAAGVVAGNPLPKQVLAADSNGGSAFWWSNGRNTFTRNVAANNDNGFEMDHMAADRHKAPIFRVQQPDGSYAEEDLRGLPFVRFEGNEAHGSLWIGVRLTSTSFGSDGRFQSDGTPPYADKRRPFIVRDLRAWDTNGFESAVSPLWTEGMRIDRDQTNHEESASGKRYRAELLDDLPPTTVITHVSRSSGKAIVRGTTADNGVVRRVLVNGEEARSIGANFAEWEITLKDVPKGPLRLKAQAEDASKNVEPRPHTITVPE